MESSVEEYQDDQNSMRAEDGEAEEEEEEARSVDPSVFETTPLPVSCGSFNGLLHKYRFVSGRCLLCCQVVRVYFTFNGLVCKCAQFSL